MGEKGLNLLLNNAGMASKGLLGALDRESLIRLFNINACGPLLLTQVRGPLSLSTVMPGV